MQQKTVDYKKNVDLDDDMLDSSPLKLLSKHRNDESASDVDFAAGESEGDDESDGVGEVDPRELQPQQERARASIATPPKGKQPPRKVIASRTKGPATEKSASAPTPIKKQQVPAQKFPIPSKASRKSEQTIPTSSNKTVGSKQLADVKSQKLQKGANVKPTNPASSIEVKGKAAMANSAPKSPAGKDAESMQPKNQEATVVKQSVPSTSSIAKSINLGSTKPDPTAKPANTLILPPNLSKKVNSAKARPVSQVKPNVAPASADNMKPVAPKTVQRLQNLETATNCASPSRSETDISNAAATSPVQSTLQIADSQSQIIGLIQQTTVRNSAGVPKKAPINPPLPNKGTTSVITKSVTTSSIPLQDPEPTKMDLDHEQRKIQSLPTKMDLDHEPGTMESEIIQMDLDRDRGLMQPQATRMDLEDTPRVSKATQPHLILRFSLPSKMADLATKITASISASSARPDTSLDNAPCK